MSRNTCEDCKSTENDVVQRQGDKMLYVACNDKLPIESDSTEDIPNEASAPAAVEPDDTVVVSQETSNISGSEVPIAECCTPSCSYGGRRSGRQILVRCSWCMRFFHKRCLTDYQDQALYSCLDCRRMPGVITDLMTAVTKLPKSVADLSKVNNDLAQQMEHTQTKLLKSVRSLLVGTGKISGKY